MIQRLVVVGMVVCLAGCVAPSRSYWLPDSQLVERIDYAPWDALLKAHVVDGVVDYPAFATSPEFREFRRTLRRSRFTEATSAEERLAFWLNAYNAAAIAGIVDGGSPETRLGRRRFFWRTLHAIGGEEITLWSLENERIRTLGDPRLHFAIVCASASCPKLASEAFVPERIDEQLEPLARAFVNDPVRNRFDAEAGVARLSQIFEWYAEDFGANEGLVAAYVARYVDDPEAAAALAEGRWEIEYLPYDWSLNGVPLGER